MRPEPRSSKLIQHGSAELPPEDSAELTPVDYQLTPVDLTAIKNTSTQLALPYVRLFRYLNSAPPSRDKERLQNIEGWRKEQRQQIKEQRQQIKEQRQQINKQCADAAKIGTEKIGTEKIGNGQQETVADQKQRQKSAHLASQTSTDQTPADQRPDINTIERKKNAEREKNAEQRMTMHREEAVFQAEEAEKKFWDLLPDLAVPPGMTFVPFTSSKLFTASECVEFPLEDAARHWFHALYEEREIEPITASALQKKRSWQEALEKTARVRRRFRSAGSAWSTHVGLLRDAIAAGYPLEIFLMEGPNAEKPDAEKPDAGKPDAGKPDAEKPDAGKPATAQDAPEGAAESIRGKTSPGRKLPAASAEGCMDWLTAWVAAEVGEQYLLPLMAELSPEAALEQRRQELILEIWGAVLSLHAHRLTVPAFCRLPTTAAAMVRELCSSAGEDVDRLAPEARRCLLAANTPAADPLAAVIKAETTEHIWERICALPPQQRRSMELLLQGFSREEIAEKIDCKPESVKEHVERARKRLRSDLAEFKLPASETAGSDSVERVAPHTGS